MEANFWHKRWADNCIGFHESEHNPLLLRYFTELSLPRGGRIFLPLCGKTLDIGWFLSEEYRVTGIELNQSAIEQLFEELGLEPKISRKNDLGLYQHDNIDIYAGDIFDLSAETLGAVDAVYDRAALVALPPEMRHRYTSRLMQITAHAHQLLLSLVYDQSQMQGPPFSVGDEEIQRHYAECYHLHNLAHETVPGGLKGLKEIVETVWILRSRKAVAVEN